jgi:hypothetical protein
VEQDRYEPQAKKNKFIAFLKGDKCNRNIPKLAYVDYFSTLVRDSTENAARRDPRFCQKVEAASKDIEVQMVMESGKNRKRWVELKECPFNKL